VGGTWQLDRRGWLGVALLLLSPLVGAVVSLAFVVGAYYVGLVTALGCTVVTCLATAYLAHRRQRHRGQLLERANA
jgi:hypothetical protein